MYEVSLIVPSYKRPQRTMRAINCILNQKFDFKFEAFIAGDKCPFIQELIESNKAANLSAKAADSGNKLTIFNMPFHYGGYGYQCRNTCIELAQGKYIMFMDNDDIIADNHIQTYFDGIDGSGYDMVFFNSYIAPLKEERNTKMERGSIGHAEIIVSSRKMKLCPSQLPDYDHDWYMIKNLIDSGASVMKVKTKPTYTIMGVGDKRETQID
jgi:glycosyltransferase involved in cell wall biosynthesis